MATSIEWTASELKIMEKDFTAWQENGGSGKDWATRCFKTVYTSRGGSSKINRNGKEILWKALVAWFSNRKRSSTRRKKPRFLKQWSFRTVILEQRFKEVQDLARKNNPELGPDRSIPVGLLQKALSQFINENYTTADMEEADDTAFEWNQLGPPPEVQAKMAETRPGMELRRLTEHLYKQYNMAIIAFTVHKDKDGRIAPCVHDWNQYGVGHGFEDLYPDWESSGKKLCSLVAEYGSKIFGMLDNPVKTYRLTQVDAPDSEIREGKGGRQINIPHSSDNTAMLPLEDPSKPWTHAEMKKIIRLFLTEHYWSAKGGRTSPSWTAIAEFTHEYIDPMYLPPGFVFVNPWKIPKETARRLLDHWYQRQNNPAITTTFQFSAYRNGRGGKAEILPAGSAGERKATSHSKVRRQAKRQHSKAPEVSDNENKPQIKAYVSKKRPRMSRRKAASSSSGEKFSDVPIELSEEEEEQIKPDTKLKGAVKERGRSTAPKSAMTQAKSLPPSRSKSARGNDNTSAEPGGSVPKGVRFRGDQVDHTSSDVQESSPDDRRSKRVKKPTKAPDGSAYGPLSCQRRNKSEPSSSKRQTSTNGDNGVKSDEERHGDVKGRSKSRKGKSPK